MASYARRIIRRRIEVRRSALLPENLLKAKFTKHVNPWDGTPVWQIYRDLTVLLAHRKDVLKW